MACLHIITNRHTNEQQPPPVVSCGRHFRAVRVHLIQLCCVNRRPKIAGGRGRGPKAECAQLGHARGFLGRARGESKVSLLLRLLCARMDSRGQISPSVGQPTRNSSPSLSIWLASNSARSIQSNPIGWARPRVANFSLLLGVTRERPSLSRSLALELTAQWRREKVFYSWQSGREFAAKRRCDNRCKLRHEAEC